MILKQQLNLQNIGVQTPLIVSGILSIINLLSILTSTININKPFINPNKPSSFSLLYLFIYLISHRYNHTSIPVTILFTNQIII